MKRDRRSFAGIVLACLLTFGYLAGCGSSGSSLTFNSGTNNAVVNPVPNPPAPNPPDPVPPAPDPVPPNPLVPTDPNFVNPAQIGPGPGPALQTVGTGNILINYVLARAIPTSVTTLEYSGFTRQGYLTYTENSARTAQVRLAGVPVNVVRLQIDLISNGALIGRASVPVEVVKDQTTTIGDPAFQDVVGPPLDLAGRYFVSGAEPTATRPGFVRGELSLDANGGVTSGALTLSSAGGGSDLVFNITGGNVTMKGDRRFSGTLIATPFNLTLNGQGSLSGALTATATGFESSGFGGVTTMLYCQKAISDVSTANVKGNFQFAAAHVGTRRTGFSNGNFQLDGAGAVLDGGALTHVDPSVGFLAITGGSYSAQADGSVSLTLNAGGTRYVLNGSIGGSGILALTGTGATGEQVFLLATRDPAFGCDASDLGTNPRTIGLVVNQAVYYSDLEIDPQGTVKNGSVTWFDKSSSVPSVNPVISGSFGFNSALSIGGSLQIRPQIAPGIVLNLNLTQGVTTSDKRMGFGTGQNPPNEAILIRGLAISSKI